MRAAIKRTLSQTGMAPCSLERSQLLLLLQPLEGSQFSGGPLLDFSPWQEGGLGLVLWPCSPPNLRKLYSVAKACFRTLLIFLGWPHLVLNPSIFTFCQLVSAFRKIHSIPYPVF